MKAANPGLVPIHVGQPAPLTEQHHSWRDRAAHFDQFGQRTGPLLHVPTDLDWKRYGLQPRWLNMESYDCSVAIEPGRFSGRGAEERNRFFAGAAHRDETALLISVIGDPDAEPIHNVFSRDGDASVDVDAHTHIVGRRLPEQSSLALAPDLGKADKDLALRLRDRDSAAPWWALQRHGGVSLSSGYGGATSIPPVGTLQPVLVNGLNEPVAAVWVSDDARRRWYILPAELNWETVLDWLQQQALPEFVPGALRRARSPRFVDPQLQSRRERQAVQALNNMEARHAEERAEIERSVKGAKDSADGMRHRLLYESGTPLADAVHEVLRAAGLHVTDLDTELGGTRSADLLVSPRSPKPPRYLVEVKGVGGTAPEKLVHDLERHLATWPQLRPDEPVAGGVLVVNHQHKVDPALRDEQVYRRKEFLNALSVTVLSARQLFDWWGEENWAAIREAICGATTAVLPHPVQNSTTLLSPAGDVPPIPTRKRWWRCLFP